MPEPDPQPPQPRPISAARWLLLLTPSMIVIILPMILSVVGKLFGHDAVTTVIVLVVILIVPAGVVLCFECGDQLEKWRHGEIRNGCRALGFGFLILIVNAITSWVAAMILSMIFSK